MTRDNYSFKKHQKELTRKKKAEEKKQRKLEKKAMEDKGPLALSDGNCAPEGGDSGQVSGEDASVV